MFPTREMLLFLTIILLNIRYVTAIVLDVNDPQSIRDAAATAAHGLQEIYNGNTTGVLGKWPYAPYYWWESGAAWGGMVNYWRYTGDASYNNVTYNALVSQLGPAGDFVMPAESFDEGNDDQAFWVLAAMSAAEYGFSLPPSPYQCWQEICINAFNDYVARWNTSTCGGGLQWQFYPSNAGFYYKNSISNGALFQLSARLARMTGNQTYFDWANKVYNWSTAIGLVDSLYNVFDGSNDMINCTQLDHHQFSYGVAVYLYGAAIMQNYTNASSIWVDRTSGFLDATATFLDPFPNATNVIFEAECEKDLTCNVDQYSFKAYLVRWLADTSIMAPFTAGRIAPILQTSAIGAAAACTAGPYGNTCGAKWYINGSDGTSGLGQQLSAMEVMYSLLANEAEGPRTLSNMQIRDEPEIATISTLPTMQPTTSPRPLFDSTNESFYQQKSGAFLTLASLVAYVLVI